MSSRIRGHSETRPFNDASPNASGSSTRETTPARAPAADDAAAKKEIQKEVKKQLRKEQTNTRCEDKEIWSKWFYPLAIGFAMNFGIWLSTIYQVYKIDNYDTHRKSYEILGWLVIFGVSVILAFSLLLVWSKHVKDRATFKKPSPNYAATLNALVCFILVIIYFRYNALPKYREPDWSFSVRFNESLPLPAFALVGGYSDDAMAKFPGGAVKCNFPRYDKPCPPGAFNNTLQTISINSTEFSNLQAYVFNPTQLESAKNGSTDLSDRVVLKANVNYDHDKLQQSYEELAVQTPYLFAVLFDPRVDLGLALSCGLVAMTEVPALASNTFTVTAATIFDTLQEISPTDTQPGCSDFYASTLKMTDPSYMTFAYHLSSMAISDPTLCDTHLNASASCVSQIILRYGTHVVNMMESRHGMEKTDILIFMGAIVGAVQFFAWFLGIFSL